MIGRRARAVVGRDRLGGRRRRAERAETVQRAQRRDGLLTGLAGHAGAGRLGVAGHVDQAPQHLDEGAGHRQVRPAHVAADMEQGDDALAAALAGHQRRAVDQRGPASLRQRGVGLGQHLPRHGHVRGHLEAGERAVGVEGGEVLGLLPGQAAAKAAVAAPQLHRHQVVLGIGEAGAGEAHQHAAALDPRIEPLAQLRRQRADVRQHDHRQLLVEELRDGLRRRTAIAEPDVGERRQRAGDVERRCQQRLCGVGGRAAGDADGPPPPPLVEQLHRAGRPFAGDLQPRDIVAQLDGKIECRLGFAVRAREAEMRFADRRVLPVERTHDAGVGAAARRPQHLHGHPGGGVLRGRQRVSGRRAAVEDRHVAVRRRLVQPRDEVGAMSRIDAVGQPGDVAVAGRLEEAVDGGERIRALDRIGLG